MNAIHFATSRAFISYLRGQISFFFSITFPGFCEIASFYDNESHFQVLLGAQQHQKRKSTSHIAVSLAQTKRYSTAKCSRIL